MIMKTCILSKLIDIMQLTVTSFFLVVTWSPCTNMRPINKAVIVGGCGSDEVAYIFYHKTNFVPAFFLLPDCESCHHKTMLTSSPATGVTSCRGSLRGLSGTTGRPMRALLHKRKCKKKNVYASKLGQGAAASSSPSLSTIGCLGGSLGPGGGATLVLPLNILDSTLRVYQLVLSSFSKCVCSK